MNHLNMKKNLQYLCIAILVASPLGQPAVRGEVIVTSVGTPVFDVVDTHLFTAPTNVFPSLFPNHFPRVAHSDYAKESSDGLILTGWPQKSAIRCFGVHSPQCSPRWIRPSTQCDRTYRCLYGLCRWPDHP